MRNKAILSQSKKEKLKSLIGKIKVQIVLDRLKIKVVVVRVGLFLLQVCWPIDFAYILKVQSRLAFLLKK